MNIIVEFDYLSKWKLESFEDAMNLMEILKRAQPVKRVSLVLEKTCLDQFNTFFVEESASKAACSIQVFNGRAPIPLGTYNHLKAEEASQVAQDVAKKAIAEVEVKILNEQKRA